MVSTIGASIKMTTYHTSLIQVSLAQQRIYYLPTDQRITPLISMAMLIQTGLPALGLADHWLVSAYVLLVVQLHIKPNYSLRLLNLQLRRNLYVRSVLWDLGVPQHAASVMYEDNDACTAMAMAQKPTPCTHHMDIKYQVICEWVERDLLHLKRIDTSINLADLFTKQLGTTLFYRHTDFVLGHVPPHYATTTSPHVATITAMEDPHPSDKNGALLFDLGVIWSTIAHNPFMVRRHGLT